MATVKAFDEPRIRDRTALKEYIEALSDYAPKVESDITTLTQTPKNKIVIANLFRTLHNIKGDAALCKVDIGVAIIHPIETLLDRVRSGKLPFTELLAEVILLAVDRLEQATELLVAEKTISTLQLGKLIHALEQLTEATQEEFDSAARQLIQSITGFRPKSTPGQVRPQNPAIISRVQEHIAEQLSFFRTLAQQYESRSPHFKGRTGRLLQLALETNRIAGNLVDPTQLEAAIYMHDIGMMFLPESIWLKTGKLTEEDVKTMHAHPAYGAGLLQRMPGWQAASEMVMQHHEMPDGCGYPACLTQDKICPGAKILAIIDAFEAVTLKHSHRSHNRSILRAISEINACENQFAQEWIVPFNQVIRHMIE